MMFLFFCVQVNSANNIRLLVLVLASDNLPVYIVEQKLWRSYMHYNPSQVTAFFIKGNYNLTSRYLIDQDIIWSKTNEGFPPYSAGLINKTVMSLEALQDRLDNFDYILRTNMSSFFIFPRLLDYLSTLPKDGVYAGVLGGQCVSGAGIIMSRDIVKLILQYKDELLNNNTDIDDVLLGTFMKEHNVSAIDCAVPRVDIISLEQWSKVKNSIPQKAFHIRTKNVFGRRKTDEIYIYKQLRNLFYGSK